MVVVLVVVVEGFLICVWAGCRILFFFQVWAQYMLVQLFGQQPLLVAQARVPALPISLCGCRCMGEEGVREQVQAPCGQVQAHCVECFSLTGHPAKPVDMCYSWTAVCIFCLWPASFRAEV
eukprot:scaffold19556_cov21-Tisochrysis_lutea.AAC.2